MKYYYLLSICMIVKDEEKNLVRCLKNLEPLLKKNDVELIIVDTGSSDNTPDISRKYTDKVYFHPWNNNFSDMRNKSISYARGRYLLILDADEVLNDPLVLYEYLKNPKFSKFNTFLLKIRSYMTSKSFAVLPQARIFVNDGEFRYSGAVHNQPFYKKPILSTDIYVDHYGYLFQDSELKEKKFRRTATLLRSEIGRNPTDPYYRFQLARILKAHGDIKEALEEIRKAYDLISSDSDKMRQFSFIYSTYSSLCLENREYEETIKICREGLEVRPEYVDIYFILANVLARLERKTEALEIYTKYIDMVERYDKLEISKDMALEMCYIGPSHRDSALVFVVNEFLRKGKYDEAKNLITKISDEESKVTLLVKSLIKLNEFDELADVYKNYCNNKHIRMTIADIIENEKKDINEDCRQKIEDVFCMEEEDPYILLNRIRRTDNDEKTSLMAYALKNIDFSELPEYFSEILSCIDVNTQLVISTLKKLNKTKIKQYVKYLIDFRPQLEEFFEKFLADEHVRSNDFQSLKVYIAIAYVYLYSKAQIWRDMKLDPPESCYAIFELYIRKGIEYVSLLYNKERLRLYYNTLEDLEDRFFISMGYALEAIERKNFMLGIKYFREALRANPSMACYMDRYKDELFPIPVKENEEETLL